MEPITLARPSARFYALQCSSTTSSSPHKSLPSPRAEYPPKAGSSSRSCQSPEPLIDGADLIRCGGLGTLLLSTTASVVSRARASPFVVDLAANPTFLSGLVAWALAQTAKFLLTFFVERRWDLSILVSSGGMPSSHSALCTALSASVALCHGAGDALFPVCLGFSLIVMYDAIGVRRHAGIQAQVLNLIVQDLFQGHPISKRKLKELLGHTPSQVVGGAMLGILVAFIICRGNVIAI